MRVNSIFHPRTVKSGWFFNQPNEPDEGEPLAGPRRRVREVEHVDGEGAVERHDLDARGRGTATAIVDAAPHGEAALEEHEARLVDHDVLVAADVAGIQGDLDRALVDVGLPAEHQLLASPGTPAPFAPASCPLGTT